MTVWAFAQITDSEARKAVCESIKNGVSRFGWSSEDNHNPLTNWIPQQSFLRQIKDGDWIVHVNMPEYGKCVAVKVTGIAFFDKGIETNWGIDFRSAIPIEKDSISEFNRRDQNILPKVNLNPRSRYHRVYEESAFFESLDNLKTRAINLKPDESKLEHHLKDSTNEVLSKLTRLIHDSHKGKELERFFAKVFRKMLSKEDVIENGFGFKSDHGADLIVKVNSGLSNVVFENQIVVQIKSFKDEHYDLEALIQIVHAIEHFKASAGIIITTAKSTKELEEAILKKSNEIDKPIDLIAGEDVARFVISNSPELLFEL